MSTLFFRNSVNTHIIDVRHREEELKWLFDLGIKANRVANFGCSIGGETLALMYYFGANETIGLDIDQDKIDQATSTIYHLRNNIKQIKRLVEHSPQSVSEEDLVWWHNVPTFFKVDLLAETSNLKYEVQDITKRSKLKSDCFDLIFCDFVLHHILYDEIEQNSSENTLAYISEMIRSVQRDGIIAVRELVQYNDKPRLPFKDLFARFDLTPIKESETPIKESGAIVGVYCYRKN